MSREALSIWSEIVEEARKALTLAMAGVQGSGEIKASLSRLADLFETWLSLVPPNVRNRVVYAFTPYGTLTIRYMELPKLFREAAKTGYISPTVAFILNIIAESM